MSWLDTLQAIGEVAGRSSAAFLTGGASEALFNSPDMGVNKAVKNVTGTSVREALSKKPGGGGPSQSEVMRRAQAAKSMVPTISTDPYGTAAQTQVDPMTAARMYKRGMAVPRAEDALQTGAMGDVARLRGMAEAPTGPSAAELQMLQALERQQAAQQSMALSNPSINPALAQRIAANNMAQMQQQTAGQSAILRAQEEAQAFGQRLQAAQFAGALGQEQITTQQRAELANQQAQTQALLAALGYGSQQQLAASNRPNYGEMLLGAGLQAGGSILTKKLGG